MQHTAEILLVQPPVQLPALYAPAVQRVEAALREMGRMPVRFHAGADFAVSYLMAPPVIRQLTERVQEHLRNGTYQEAEEGILQWGIHYAAGLDAIDDSFADRNGALMAADASTVSNCTFLTLVQAIQRLDDALRLASAAYFPIHLDRRGFGHPNLDDASTLGAYLKDPDQNPFLEYARRWCRPTVAIETCAAIVLVVATPGQLAGALTLAGCWQEARPSLPLAVFAVDERLQRVADLLFDGAAPFDEEIVRTLQRAVQSADIPSEDVGAGKTDQVTRPQPHGSQGALVCPLQPEHEQHLPAAWRDGDGRVVVWHQPRGTQADISGLLFRSAKNGHWNHLVLSPQDDPKLAARLVRLADENPYIIHSWCRREPPASLLSDAMDRYPVESPSYGETRPLPGRPLWQRLQDPAFLQTCVAQHGPKRLARQRLSEDGGAVTTLGSRIVYRYLPPRELPAGYLDEICRMVEAGGTVGSQWLRHNLERAFLIGYAEENGIIVGNSSLKHPREAYVDAVSAQCGIDLHHYLERGYTSVRPEYRSMGVGAKLLEGLTERAEGYNVYSVIAEDNVATQKMAVRNRTLKVASFFSRRTQKQIGIWIPERMLPEGVTLPRQPDLD